jgi:hypothetical protein
MAGSTEKRLRALADKQEIAELLYNLCHLIDTFQPERLANEIYSAEGSDDHGGGPVRGREAIRAWYEDATRNVAAAAHNVTNLVIDLDGDRATARCNVIAWIWTMENADRGPTRNADYALSVVYRDELSRYPEGWRLDSRLLVSNASKAGTSHVMALGTLPDTQRGIHALSEREPPAAGGQRPAGSPG